MAGLGCRLSSEVVQTPWLCSARDHAQQMGGLLAWFLGQAGLLDGFRGCLGSLAKPSVGEG